MSMTTKGAPLFRGSPPRFVGYQGQLKGAHHTRWHKTDYKMMAEAIRIARERTRLHDDQEVKLRGVAEVMCALIEACKADNPRFEELYFIQACTKGEADEG